MSTLPTELIHIHTQTHTVFESGAMSFYQQKSLSSLEGPCTRVNLWATRTQEWQRMSGARGMKVELMPEMEILKKKRMCPTIAIKDKV